MTVHEYIKSLRPALPLSREKAGDKSSGHSEPSNGEIKRWIASKSVLLNGEFWTPEEEAPAYVWQLVFFPKSSNRATVI